MKKHIQWLLAALCCGLAAGGCWKDVSFDTTVILKGWTQEVSGGGQEPLHDLMLYGYAVDTVEWRVASYDDALAMRMTNKSDGSVLESPTVAGTPYEMEGFGRTMAMQVTSDYLTVVVVDLDDRLYGYGRIAFSENMPQMYLSILFQPWKKSNFFKNGSWWMCNDFYVVDATCVLRPTVQYAEEEEPYTLRNGILYAYETDDPSPWVMASPEEAVSGLLTDPLTGEQLLPERQATADSAGTITLDLQPGTYVLAAVDTTNGCYALCRYTTAASGEKEELTLCFAPWRTDSPYGDGAWQVWNFLAEEPEPEEPETPETPDPDAPGGLPDPDSGAASTTAARR